MELSQLGKILSALGASEAAGAVETAIANAQDAYAENAALEAARKTEAIRGDDAERKAETLAERLKQAMLREQASREAFAKLEAEAKAAIMERDAARAEIARMESHPEVRAARREKLLAESKRLSQLAVSLADPIPAEEDKAENTDEEPTATAAKKKK